MVRRGHGRAVEDGLLRGTDKGLLNPQGNLTRAEMAVIIDRSFGTYVKADITSYQDVKPGAGTMTMWPWRCIWAHTRAGTSGPWPRTAISLRQEAMTVVARALQLDAGDYEDASLSQFRDRSEVSAWALP